MVRMAIVAANGERIALNVHPANPEVQRQVIQVSESVDVFVTGKTNIPTGRSLMFSCLIFNL